MNGHRPEDGERNGRAKRPSEPADDTNVVRIGDWIRRAGREPFGPDDDPGGPAHDPTAA